MSLPLICPIDESRATGLILDPDADYPDPLSVENLARALLTGAVGVVYECGTTYYKGETFPTVRCLQNAIDQADDNAENFRQAAIQSQTKTDLYAAASDRFIDEILTIKDS